jgi:hypothetical protein
MLGYQLLNWAALPRTFKAPSVYFPHLRGAGDGVERLWGVTGTVFGPGFGVVRVGRQTYFAMLDFSLSGIHDRLSIPSIP